MKKFVIDISKPIGHPEREQLLDMTPQEIKALEAEWAADAEREANKPKTDKQRIEELEAKLEQLMKK